LGPAKTWGVGSPGGPRRGRSGRSWSINGKGKNLVFIKKQNVGGEEAPPGPLFRYVLGDGKE